MTPDNESMLPWLARELERIRTDAELSRRALAPLVGLEHSTLGPIERGEKWPRDVDGTIAAYARVGGVSPLVIWARAVGRWARASRDPEAADAVKRLFLP